MKTIINDPLVRAKVEKLIDDTWNIYQDIAKKELAKMVEESRKERFLAEMAKI
jgi:hypothetical protein